MAKPPKPIAPPPALRSEPLSFSDRVEGNLQFWPILTDYMDAVCDFTDEQADASIAAATAGGLPSLTGKAGRFIRVAAAADNVEFSDDIALTKEAFSGLGNTGDMEFVFVGGRSYQSAPDGPFTSADGRKWKPLAPSSTGRPIFVLATGQSNMLGHSGPSTGDRRTLNGSVYVWEQFPGAGQTAGWKVAGPDSPDWPFLATGNSLAYHFCDALQRATGRPVYLVFHATGGQPIAQWLPGGGGVAGATGHMFSTLNSVLTSLRAAPLPTGGTLASHGIEAADIMLWHQGEADADYQGTTGAQWIGRFKTMVATMRDPSSGGSGAAPFIKPNAPVLVGELLHGGTNGGAVGVGSSTDDRNVEIALLDAQEPLVAAVSSRDLDGTDNLHFSGAALQEFGDRYFRRLGAFPKAMPIVETPDKIFLGGKMVLLRSAGTVTINAGVTTQVALGVTMANANYVPIIALVASGSSASPYGPRVENRTPSTFNLRNSGAVNMVVSWMVIDQIA